MYRYVYSHIITIYTQTRKGEYYTYFSTHSRTHKSVIKFQKQKKICKKEQKLEKKTRFPRNGSIFCFHFDVIDEYNSHNWFSIHQYYLHHVKTHRKLAKYLSTQKELQKKFFFLLKFYYYLRRSVRHFSHNFLKCGCFFSLFLIVQSDFLAEFPRISHYRLRLWYFCFSCLFWVNESLILIFFLVSLLPFFMYSKFYNCTYYSRLKLSQ